MIVIPKLEHELQQHGARGRRMRIRGHELKKRAPTLVEALQDGRGQRAVVATGTGATIGTSAAAHGGS